jgi:hypothetical protein
VFGRTKVQIKLTWHLKRIAHSWLKIVPRCYSQL